LVFGFYKLGKTNKLGKTYQAAGLV
jgi:hypothetical protein